ncbi:MAG: CBS domain-containing protein [Bacteroidetes bacterium]|nr:CBS domain-containing protein [Bacteroidota bacterium]
MIARDLISPLILPAKPSDTFLTLVTYMEDHHIQHLPLIEQDEYLGIIAEADLYNHTADDNTLNDLRSVCPKPFIHAAQHIYDVIEAMVEHKLTVLPVLDEKQHYMGVITVYDLMNQIPHLASLQNPGGIIVLEVNDKDYILTEIAQIVESNDAKVLSLYVNSHADSTKLEVTLKINKMDIRPVIQTFTRYNYLIKATFTENEFNDYLLERYESLMNYLNI